MYPCLLKRIPHGYRQIFHPPLEDPHLGPAKPPFPVGIPSGLKEGADMSFFTSLAPQIAQDGSGSDAFRAR